MINESLIVKFFENSLSEKERLEFENLMESDSEFQEEVQLREALKDAITKQDRNNIKQELQSFESSSDKNAPFINWRIAASIVILIGLSAFWFLRTNTLNSEELFVQYFEPSRNLVQPIVRGESPKDIKSQAFTAYETKNYEEALSYFDQMLEQNNDKTISFYKANVLLELNKTEEAITIFNDNLKTSDSLEVKNKWYLALALLKINDIEQAKKQLQDLVDTDSKFKANQVQELLKALK